MNTNETNLVSVYHFAKSIDKAPQQLYSMIKNGSLPSELYEFCKLPSGKEQPMVRVEEATIYFSSKEDQVVQKAVTKVIKQPEMIAEAFIEMIEKDNVKLGAQVRKWWKTKNSSTPEEK